MCGNKNLIRLLEEAKAAQLSEFPYRAQEIADKMHPKKCTVFPFPPRDSKEDRKPGIVLWLRPTIKELINTASEKLEFEGGICILSEDAGKILDVGLINDGQKLYLVTETYLN
ncbi:potassium channel SKOR-like [Rosa rugosa]|uniref:potassium channel SKOR-like n=1 Tax=Rosa rugosa TaxID=74645 RepID=UPI002B40777B|nr:potassium channel SKOR-like [Rosa rugosa]